MLPKISYQHSPNQSQRLLHRGIKPYLLVAHRPVGSYHGSADWLCNPKSEASAHLLTEGNGTGVDVATQLVPWDQKAWACMSFNSVSYNIEVDDDAWNGKDPEALLVAQRVFGFLCHKTGIPAQLSKRPTHDHGIISHFLLGIAGGRHTDPTEEMAKLTVFIKGVQYQVNRGGFRSTYGKGRLVRA
jgi:N-acetyl-anhydromuramyl-L-alanine amidase AmpD